MPRMNEWQLTMHEAVRREHWSLRGPNQVVKVVPADRAVVPRLGGYITLGRFLLGMTPTGIEHALGLPFCFLSDGARIYRFMRLPQPSEYEYELTADYPGGLAYDPAYGNPDYPSGSSKILQWRIKPGVLISLDTINVLDLRPGQTFPYAWLLS